MQKFICPNVPDVGQIYIQLFQSEQDLWIQYSSYQCVKICIQNQTRWRSLT